MAEDTTSTGDLSDDATIDPSGEPVIDPSSFDLVICGTGLPESLIAAAASAAGKSVLQVDPNPFYGSHFSSISPHALTSFLHQTPTPSPTLSHSSPHDFIPIDLRPLYSDLDVHGEVPEPSGSFLVDVSGPRVLYCADPMVDVMLRSGASHHVDFKSLDASLFYWEGELCNVPDSREAIFRDRSLGLKEKSQMMRFLRMVKGFVAEEGDSGIVEGDLELPFVEFLDKQRLPKKIQSIVLYAIAMADHDQDSHEDSKRLIKTKEGLERLALYSSSIGRFPNAIGAFIYPIYGQGELPQAFCRCAAVKGAIYVLRMPVAGLLINKEDGQCEGVRLGSGQNISCQQLLVDPLFTIPSSVAPDLSDGGSEDRYQKEPEDVSKITGKVARMVCITRCSIQPDLSNILVVFPPKSLHAEQRTAIRVLQLSSNVVFCPSNKFLLYLSTSCNSALQGKEYLHAALNALSNPSGKSKTTNSEGAQEAEPIVLWNASYIQGLRQVSFDKFFSSPMPDSSLDYGSTLDTTAQLFHKMYPHEEFLPQRSTNETIEGDDN